MDYILVVKDNSRLRPYILNLILKGSIKLYKEY